jgi:uncharacterized protein (TIGR03437 family)
MISRSVYPMLLRLLGCFTVFAFFLSAQLIPAGTPVPRTPLPAVVFLNGHQNDCTNAPFFNTFGIADQVLQSNGQVSLFFNNCSVPGDPSIEALGSAFGAFLSGLRYEDGQPVETVDVVAHSMGGLIVRSYLSGKQETAGAFSPPAVTHIRKIVFLATPHFGTGIAVLFGFTTQVQELASGSQFLFDLATWNQGIDDLRGVDAVTVVGNGGTGSATTPGFDDGVVALTSASLGFYMPGRTRVVPFCHTQQGGLLSLAGFCDSNVPGIAHILSATQDPARVILSFLNGTTDWQNVGQTAEQNPFLSVDGGLDVTARTADDAILPLDSITAASPLGVSKNLNLPSRQVAYTDMFLAGPVTLSAVSGSTNISESVTLSPGVYEALTVKPGPAIARVFPAAGGVFPLSLAPRMLVAIYGTALASQTQQASGTTWPLQLGGTTVLLNGALIPLLYVSPKQINALMPESAAGLMRLTVQNSTGSRTVNIFVEPSMPAIFTQDMSGTGAAAALNARDQSLIRPTNPLHAGDRMELFVTGLGLTTNRNGLDYANQQPTVTIAGRDCPVKYAGRAPGFIGLDQINCQVPTGISPNSAAQLFVTSGGHISNIAVIALQ